jgi:hypothetical protein
VKALLGFRAKGRDVIEGCGGYQLREGAAHWHSMIDGGNFYSFGGFRFLRSPIANATREVETARKER